MTTPYRGMQPGEFLPAGDVHHDDPPPAGQPPGERFAKLRRALESAIAAQERLWAAQTVCEDAMGDAVNLITTTSASVAFVADDGERRSLIIGQHVVEYESTTGTLRITRAAVL